MTILRNVYILATLKLQSLDQSYDNYAFEVKTFMVSDVTEDDVHLDYTDTEGSYLHREELTKPVEKDFWTWMAES